MGRLVSSDFWSGAVTVAVSWMGALPAGSAVDGAGAGSGVYAGAGSGFVWGAGSDLYGRLAVIWMVSCIARLCAGCGAAHREGGVR